MRSLAVLCLVIFYDVAAILAADGDACYLFAAQVDPGKTNVTIILANFATSQSSVTVQNIGMEGEAKLEAEIPARSLVTVEVPGRWIESNGGEIQTELVASFAESSEEMVLNGKIQLVRQPRVLIQLSHSVYSPGDYVRYRIVLTDGLTKPLAAVDGPLDVTVALRHEAQHTVGTWDVQLHPGEIHSGQHLLADDRDAGSWNLTVTVGGRTTMKPFEVVQNSAPIHRITIKATTMNDKLLVLDVKAFYTFGRPIDGTMSVTLSGGDYLFSATYEKLPNSFLRIPMNKLLDVHTDQPVVRAINVSVTVDTTNGLSHRTYHQSRVILVHPDAHQLTLHRMVGFVAGQNATLLVKVARLAGDPYWGPHQYVSVDVRFADVDDNSYRYPTFNAPLARDGTAVLSVPTPDLTALVTFSVSYKSLSSSLTLEDIYKPELFVRIIPVDVGVSDQSNFKLGVASSHIADGLIVIMRDHSDTDSEHGIISVLQNYQEFQPTGTGLSISRLKSVHLFAKVDDMLVQTSVSHDDPGLPRQVHVEVDYQNGEHVLEVYSSDNSSAVGVAVYEGTLDKEHSNTINDRAFPSGTLYEMADEFAAVSANEVYITPSHKVDSNGLHHSQRSVMANTKLNQLLLWQQGSIRAPDQGTQFKFKAPSHVNHLTLTAFTFSNTTGLDVAVPVYWRRNGMIEIQLHVPYSARKAEPVSVDIYVVNNRGYRVDFVLVELLNVANEFTFLNNSGRIDGGYRMVGRIDATRKWVHGKLEPNEVQRAEFLIRPRKLGSVVLKAIAYSSNNVITTAEAILRTVPESVLHTENIVRTFSIENSAATFSDLKISFPPTAEPGTEQITLALRHDQPATGSLSAGALLDRLVEADPFTMLTKASLTLDVLVLADLDWTERYAQATDMVNKSLHTIEGYANGDGSFEFGNAHQPCWHTLIAVQAVLAGNRQLGSLLVRNGYLPKVLSWLSSRQASDGHFCESESEEGLRLEMRVELTAHVLVIFSSMPSLAWQHVAAIGSARGYLKSQVAVLEDSYHLALVGYALQFSAKTKTGTSSDASAEATVNAVLNALLQQRKLTPMHTKMWWSSSSGRNLEATSYALLLLTTKNLLLDAAPVVNWIKQQPYRRMAPIISPDSHIALKALIAYARRTSFLDREYTAAVVAKTKGKAVIYETTLQRDSKTHVVTLPPATRLVSFTINGTIAGTLEINYSYMESVTAQTSKFGIEVVRYGTSTLDYSDWSVCVRFLPKGHLERTRMVACEISFPAGYIALDDSVDELEQLDSVVSITRRNDESQLVITFEEITLQGRCFNVTGFRRSYATRQLSGTVRVFDITDTSNFAIKNFDTQN